jgi:hypothetical protein
MHSVWKRREPATILVASVAPILVVSRKSRLVAFLPFISGIDSSMSPLPLIGLTLASLSFALVVVFRLRRHTGRHAQHEESDHEFPPPTRRFGVAASVF